ncbi:hypothetical protein [Winogradskyella poriferorum]|uniref:hypothetical protein n=1 Tax=Winogradskyella poriferorum TaxID=307627 RepID=UPI003D65A214
MRDLINYSFSKYFNILLLSFLTVIMLSCNGKNPNASSLDIAKKYYQALDKSNREVMSGLLEDTLYTVETDYNYKHAFTKEDYVNNWMVWDSLFNPTYTVLEIDTLNDQIKAIISKHDMRIQLLHEAPTVWTETMYIKDNKITRIERQNVTFNDSIWIKNRAELINWVNINHPELIGFLDGQNKSIGKKYLKAITLFNNSHQ